jgi:hypothetical protein
MEIQNIGNRGIMSKKTQLLIGNSKLMNNIVGWKTMKL